MLRQLEIKYNKKPSTVFLNTMPKNKIFQTNLNIKEDVVGLFIDAIKNDDKTQLYLSKHLKAIGGIDIDELKEIFHHNNKIKFLGDNLLYNNKLIRRSSILVLNDAKSIIHMYIVKEPDKYGTWKICGIEKEN